MGSCVGGPVSPGHGVQVAGILNVTSYVREDLGMRADEGLKLVRSGLTLRPFGFLDARLPFVG